MFAYFEEAADDVDPLRAGASFSGTKLVVTGSVFKSGSKTMLEDGIK